MGGAAQIKAMKKVAGRLRLDLAQFRALEAFAQFGSELDKASQQQLARGARVVEVLKQPQYDPQPVEREVVPIYAVTGGYLDDLPGRGREAVRGRVLDSLDARHPEHLRGDPETGDLPDETEATLKAAIEASRPSFRPTPGGARSGAGRGRRRPTRSSPTWAGTGCPRWTRPRPRPPPDGEAR